MNVPILVVVGPTAVGKTEIAIEVAQRLDGEIISADSRQVYRRLELGTAKPSPEQRRRVPHHLVDVVDPGGPFSVSDFQRYCHQALVQVWGRGKLPLLVGGTGLFVQSVVDGFVFSTSRADPRLRRFMEEWAHRFGELALWNKLAAVDPAAANRVHPHNLRRVIRGLEVFMHTGKALTQWETQGGKRPDLALCMVGLYMERERLYRRIEERVDQMVKAGLVEEVRSLYQEGLGPETNAMQSLGYKEIVACLEGRHTLEEALEELKKNTRRFAKRQLTWFRRDSRVAWFAVDGTDRETLVQSICEHATGGLSHS